MASVFWKKFQLVWFAGWPSMQVFGVVTGAGLSVLVFGRFGVMMLILGVYYDDPQLGDFIGGGVISWFCMGFNGFLIMVSLAFSGRD